MTNRIWCIGILIISYLVTSCHYNYYNAEEIQESVTYMEENTLFEKQIENVGDEFFEEYLFSCSDTSYLGSEGSTIWTTISTDSNEENEFMEFTAVIHKSSGNAQAGYGLIFCQNEDKDKGQCLLCVLININGYYCIGKLNENSFEQITGWTICPNLYVGYTANRITIMKNENKYEVYFNNILSAEFFDKDPVLETGKRGFVAVISPKEKFPQQSVKIRYGIKK